jgi:hypothetical protein
MIVDSLWFRSTLVLITLLLVALWAAMLIIVVPHIDQLTGGITIFDMRPTGYGPEVAKALVSGLGPEGIDYYLGMFQRLDTLFPVLFAVTIAGWNIVLVSALRKTGLNLPVALGGLLVVLSLVGAVGDYSENGAVRQILLSGPEGPAAELVAHASAAGMVKFAGDIAAALALAILLVTYVVRRRRQS